MKVVPCKSNTPAPQPMLLTYEQMIQNEGVYKRASIIYPDNGERLIVLHHTSGPGHGRVVLFYNRKENILVPSLVHKDSPDVRYICTDEEVCFSIVPNGA